MHSVRLKIDDKIFDRLIWLLSKFSKEELEIEIEDENYTINKKYLESELKEMQEGRATFISVNEAEARFENAIKKHENNL
jgi:hypothetical protein